MDKFKNKMLKYFIAFLAIMFAMTFISRMLYSERLPRVTAASVKYQSIVHYIKGSGTVEAVKKNPFFVSSGLRVNEVMVKDGDKVNSGDVLFTLDMEYLNEKISSYESEISYELNSQPGVYNNTTKSPVFTESGLRVREVYVMPGDTVSDGQALFRLDMDYLTVKINDLTNEINSDIFNREGCYAREDNNSADAISAAMNVKLDQAARYESIYSRDGVIYSNMDGVVTNVNISPGDITSDTAAVLLSSDPQYSDTVNIKRTQIEKLRVLAENNGNVVSNTTGTVSDLNIRPGDITGDTSALCISDSSAGMYFSSQLSEADASYISIGDTVTVRFRNGKIRSENCEITNIKKSQQEKEYIIEASIKNDQVQIDEIGEFNFSAMSSSKYYCFPASAVHFDSESRTEGYVYLLKETEGFIDVENEVWMMRVTIDDSNDAYYGVASPDIMGDEQFVLSSTKELSDRQKVRII